MSIKPVDFQVMLPKTSDVSRMHSDEQNKTQLFQQQQQLSTQSRAEGSVRQVHSREKPQDARIRDKEERDREKRKNEKQKKEDNLNHNDKKKSNSRSSYIDIRI